MDFSIVTDTAGASVSELSSDLRDLLVDKINKKYEKYNISIGIAIRCLQILIEDDRLFAIPSLIII